MSKIVLVLIALFALVATIALTRSESQIDRKAREEAAINSGRIESAPEGTSDGAHARAAAIEAAEIERNIPPLECRPDIPAAECQAAQESLAGDLDSMASEAGAECARAREQVAQGKAQLRAQSGDLEADLDALVDAIEQTQGWIASNCTR